MVYLGNRLRGLVSMLLGNLAMLGGRSPMLGGHNLRLVVVSSQTLSVGGHGASAHAQATIRLVFLQGRKVFSDSLCSLVASLDV
jgi:hypothetical protein